MRIVKGWSLAVTLIVVLAVSASADSGKRFVVTDDCAPNADWGPGGCLREDGEVTRAEFASANANRYPGHPAWRIVPPYIAEQSEDEIRVTNTGGRGHTFTEVERFGGGFVPALNPPGSLLAPECAIANPDGTLRPAPPAAATTLAPGDQLRVEDLRPGTHNFQCCIHPWMRTTVKIKADDDHDDRH
jgi:hypothetical protein